MQLLRLAWALTAAAVCFLLLLILHNHILREGQLAAGTCEVVTLDRDSSQPRRTIARQTARCACRKGQIAGTTRARPACVDGLLTAAARTHTPQRERLVPIVHRPSVITKRTNHQPLTEPRAGASSLPASCLGELCKLQPEVLLLSGGKKTVFIFQEI
ncbi:uncharacterized protein LOC120564807 isoform X1 [Perca fluviatilis]|uniref:uncharacterized protein LOC120564807 isoform X1 n=1 Tax=Perca fluviatilis TaxID=8168 RepID=UPI0019623FB3|nr:uncharacterized protein LOC120564807 isoform X1 [Perca fluviatilis]